MNTESRRYFRINDSVGIAYRLLGLEEVKALAEQIQDKGSLIDFASNFDNRIQTLIDSCRVQAPIAAELIDLMNKKLNFVIHQMDIDTEMMQNVAYTLRQVNVSACGVAFYSDEQLEKDTRLQLDIVLHPSDLHIVTLARVIACNLVEDDDDEKPLYFLRMNYESIHSDDQELLIQHIVKQQCLQLKQKRLDEP